MRRTTLWTVPMLLAVLGIPAGVFSQAGDALPPPILAVFDIEAKGVDLSPEALDNLADYLATRLAESGRYQVVPRPEVKSRLAEAQNEGYKECYDESCQIQMGRECV